MRDGEAPRLRNTHPSSCVLLNKLRQYRIVTHSRLNHDSHPARCATPTKKGNSRFTGTQTGPRHSCEQARYDN